MRHLLFFVLFLTGISAPALAQSLRVVTWELDNFEPLTPDVPPPDADVRRMRQAASQLKPLDAEMIVIQGLSDRNWARRLTTFLKPATYHVVYHGSFKKGGTNNTVVGMPITILSKRQASSARSMEWKATGQIDLPGGFVFATFGIGPTNALGLYVAQLPQDPAAVYGEGDTQGTARKRELSAQYLAHHAGWLGSTWSNLTVSFLFAGNYSIDSRSTRTEGAVGVLQQAGFKRAFPTAPAGRPDSSVPPAEGEFARLTGMLAKNVEFSSTPQMLPKKAFTQGIVAYDFVPVAPCLTPTPPPTPPVAAAPSGPVPAKVVELDPQIVWLWIGGIGALSLTVIFAVLRLRNGTARTTVLHPGANSVVLDVSAFSPPSPAGEFADPGQESYSGSTSDSAHAQAALWQARALQAEERAEQAAVAARNSLVPQVSRLLKQRLFSWLASQRTQLLTSQELGTQQVLELEERLVKIQSQFQDRLRGSEDRIAELEREILAKEKLIRDLLRAQVRSANESTGHTAVE